MSKHLLTALLSLLLLNQFHNSTAQAELSPQAQILPGRYATKVVGKKASLEIEDMFPRYVVSGITNWEFYNSHGFLINFQNAEFSADVRLTEDEDGYPVFRGVGALVLNRNGLICSLPYRMELRSYKDTEGRRVLRMVDESSRVVRAWSVGAPCRYDGVLRRAHKHAYYYSPFWEGDAVDLLLPETSERLVLVKLDLELTGFSWEIAHQKCRSRKAHLASHEEIRLGYTQLFSHPQLFAKMRGPYLWTRDELSGEEARVFSVLEPDGLYSKSKNSKHIALCSVRY